MLLGVWIFYCSKKKQPQPFNNSEEMEIMNNSTTQKISAADFSLLQRWAGPTFAALSKLFWARQETSIQQTRIKTITIATTTKLTTTPKTTTPMTSTGMDLNNFIYLCKTVRRCFIWSLCQKDL